MVEAVKLNYPQREIAEAAFALQQEIDAGERTVVGVNSFVAADEEPIPTLQSTRRSDASRSTACRPRAPSATAPRSSARWPSCASTRRTRSAT